ncbi:MAG: SDR family NAD(P)-dependent oxidoreductase [Verrucomicrobia bacterium]|nr:SDR family NAD(P)-dependent oxidoreductase [Verrucomicrobiota bacterium]
MSASCFGGPDHVALLSSLYRTAFVTGASAGLGRAIVELLLAEGVRVWGTARDAARLTSLEVNSNFSAVVLDLDNPEEAESAFANAATAAGGFDLVVNNAGYGVFAPFTGVDFSIWQKQFDAMIGTKARLSHTALRGMLAKKRGCLVNVASLATDFPLPFMSGYNVAKAGLSALSESLIFETRGTGVVVIDFRPGDFRTGFNNTMQAKAVSGSDDARLASAWRGLEKNLNDAPPPKYIAAGLRKALLRQRSGTVRCGSFFQAHLAPFLIRFAPSGLRRAITARYFGAV